MSAHLRWTCYWPWIAVDISSTVRSCPHCARNRLRLILHKQSMRLFHSMQHLKSLAVNVLGPLPTTKAGNRFILVMADRIPKLSQVVPLKRTTVLDVAKAFASDWAFKYGAAKEVLSDNGSRFARKLYQNTCRILGISNTFT